MKKQLLDPIGTLCKLVGLQFAKFDTKIKIKSHILRLDEPDQLQFLFRWYNGDGRENISELYYVIIRIIKWYLMNNETNINDNKNCKMITINNSDNILYNIDECEPNYIKLSRCSELKIITKYACNALKILQETYQFGNVILALQYLINILESGLDGTFNEDMLPEYIKYEEHDNLLDYNKIKNFWEVKTLATICELYDNCFRVINDKDVSDKTRNALIEGYLKSINATLDIIDNDFQTLLDNSNKG